MKLNFLIIAWPYVLLIILTMVSIAQAARTDIVVLRNGDLITGEIKELKYAKLKYKTDDIGTIYIEWKKVRFLKSEDTFVIGMQDGDEYFGRIDSDSTAKRLLIITKDRTIRIDPIFVVEITPVKDRFWSRIDGNVSLGLSYGKASGIGIVSLGGLASYRTRKIMSNMDLSLNVTFQEGVDNIERHNLTSTTFYIFSRPWAVGGGVGLERSTEFDVNLRLLLSGGIGRYLIQTNVSQLIVLLGLQFNEEWKTDSLGSLPGQTNLEGAVSVDFRMFRYDTPKLDFTTALSIFPNLTPIGRVRGNLELDFKWELVEDLFWKVDFFYEFDSDAAEDNWSITLFGLEWEY